MGAAQQAGQGGLANALQLLQSEGRGRDLVLVPEAIRLLQLLELQGQQAANGGSKQGSHHRLLEQGAHQKINVLSVSEERRNFNIFTK